MGHRIAKHVGTTNTANTNPATNFILESSTYYVLDASRYTMSVYERTVNGIAATIKYEQAEKHIYGSGRLGVMNVEVNLLGTAGTAAYSQTNWTHRIGQRTYELTNHLGNVLSVISDKVIPHVTGSTISYYKADILQAQDYSPFGVTLKGRNFKKTGVNDKFRFGFQDQEMDDEIKGEGNSYDFGARMLDTRLGRWFNIDPYYVKYPANSPYCSFVNNPLVFTDPTGEDVEPVISSIPDLTGKYTSIGWKGESTNYGMTTLSISYEINFETGKVSTSVNINMYFSAQFYNTHKFYREFKKASKDLKHNLKDFFGLIQEHEKHHADRFSAGANDMTFEWKGDFESEFGDEATYGHYELDQPLILNGSVDEIMQKIYEVSVVEVDKMTKNEDGTYKDGWDKRTYQLALSLVMDNAKAKIEDQLGNTFNNEQEEDLVRGLTTRDEDAEAEKLYKKVPYGKGTSDNMDANPKAALSLRGKIKQFLTK